MTRVAGYCPMGCGETLILGAGGHVTCGDLACAEPCAPDLILHESETAHIVDIAETSFAITHPLRDRIDLTKLVDCTLHAYMSALAGPPRTPGRYRVALVGADPNTRTWHFEEIPSGGDRA